jgi:hypothetical protein
MSVSAGPSLTVQATSHHELFPVGKPCGIAINTGSLAELSVTPGFRVSYPPTRDLECGLPQIRVSMTNGLEVLALLAIWILLQVWLLPRLGVPT